MSVYDGILKWEETQREEGEWDIVELALSQSRHVSRPVIKALDEDKTAKFHAFISRALQLK